VHRLRTLHLFPDPGHSRRDGRIVVFHEVFARLGKCRVVQALACDLGAVRCAFETKYRPSQAKCCWNGKHVLFPVALNAGVHCASKTKEKGKRNAKVA